jgi:hypothetical protein
MTGATVDRATRGTAFVSAVVNLTNIDAASLVGANREGERQQSPSLLLPLASPA